MILQGTGNTRWFFKCSLPTPGPPILAFPQSTWPPNMFTVVPPPLKCQLHDPAWQAGPVPRAAHGACRVDEQKVRGGQAAACLLLSSPTTLSGAGSSAQEHRGLLECSSLLCILIQSLAFF